MKIIIDMDKQLICGSFKAGKCKEYFMRLKENVNFNN